MFKTTLRVRLYDTDAVGILYFGNQFRFAHDAFEQFLDRLGLDFKHFLEASSYIFVIVHAQSDYLHPLHVGDFLRVELGVSRVGETSFEISYFFYKDQALVGKSKTVHVCLNRSTQTKQPLPDTIRSKLGGYVIQ